MSRVATYEKCHYCRKLIDTRRGYHREKGNLYHKQDCLNLQHRKEHEDACDTSRETYEAALRLGES